MENGLKTIKELFDGTKIFKIPLYQRAYSWSDKQLTDFIEDIKNQKTDRTYFLGTILLEKAKSEGDFRGIDIVDGQQRMTTLVIFMKVLLKLLKEKGEEVEILEETYLKYKNRYKLHLQDEDSEFFQTYILEDTSNPEMSKIRPSQKKLLGAKKYFHSKLSLLNKEELIEIKEKINKTKLLTYSVNDSAEATLIFETTNDRGKPLTNLEKIKSFLMYKCYLASEESIDILKKIYKRFSDIYDIIESLEIDNEDNILQYHFIAFENWGSKTDYQEYVKVIKSNINNLLLDGKDEEVIKYIENYSTKLRETFFTINEIQNKIELKPLREVFMLERLGLTFYPLLIKSFQLDRSEDKKSFEEIVKLIEIFSFRVLGMKSKRSSDVDSAVNKIVREFSGDFEDLKLKLTEKILEYCNDSKFKEKLNSKDFYHDFPRDRVYFFWKYENYLRKKNGYSPMSEEEFSTTDSRFQLTIEHIAPQNPDEEEKRIVATEDCEFPEYNSDEFKEEYLHSIGNLTFDPRSSNSSKGRKPIEEKNSKYFRKAPFMTQNELEDEYLEKNQWNVNSINKRKERLISFALERWDPLNIIGQEVFDEYIDHKESSPKKLEKVYGEDYARTRMSSESYALLQELRRQIKNITEYEEKINKHFIGFKNNQNYFGILRWRKGYISFVISGFRGEIPDDKENMEYYPKKQKLVIKMYSKDEILRYLPLIKRSKMFKA
ncbi:DUF262 domain-containing protein [archaeon]|jgi:hypothetical protein|nr:DUF262 domain-containing protein [archaeon]